MKIGIITQKLFNNYGGLLQNYALQVVLKRLGCEVVTIDIAWKSKIKFRFRFINFVKIILHTIGLFRNKSVFLTDYDLQQINKYTQYFVDKYIVSSPCLIEYNETRNYVVENSIDTIIVGSDQVWRPSCNEIYHTFLDFAENLDINRIAYAASFGVDIWEFTIEQTQRCAYLAKKFHAISVREDSGVDLCKKFLGVEAVHLLDPTILLDTKDYERLVLNENEQLSPGTLFYYILDNNLSKKSIVDRVATLCSLIPFSNMPTSVNAKYSLDDCVYPPVTRWLRAFMDSQYVVTDSFHGVVFSIIFNKPFIAIANQGRGLARFTSLLKLFSLENRLIFNPEDLVSVLESTIDWPKVNKTRSELKEKSIDFLKKNLGFRNQ